MRVTFDLSDSDLDYFKRALFAARSKAHAKTEAEIEKGADGLLSQLEAVDLSDFVRQRFEKLRTMIDILRDEEWRLEDADRSRVVDAIAYFADPEDLIPDRIPGLGYVDDAIMIELVAQELKPDIDAYEDFCRFRSEQERTRGSDEAPATREEWLGARRQQLHQRVRRRRSRRRSSLSSSSGRSPFSLW